MNQRKTIRLIKISFIPLILLVSLFLHLSSLMGANVSFASTRYSEPDISIQAVGYSGSEEESEDPKEDPSDHGDKPGKAQGSSPKAPNMKQPLPKAGEVAQLSLLAFGVMLLLVVSALFVKHRKEERENE
jgi:LPXTG-motif cell wall-anchored protein